MFSYKTLIYTLSVLLLGGCLYWRLSTSSVKAEEEPAPPANGEKAPPRPKDLDTMIEEVPLAALDEGVLMQAEDIKVAMATVEKAEKGFVETKKKQDPKFNVEPQFQNYMRKQFAFRFFANQLVEKYAKESKLEIPKENEAEFKKFKVEQEGRGANYEEWLANTGMTDDEFKHIWSLNWALEQKVAATVKDEDIDKKYDSFKEQMDNIPLRRASHILLMYKGAQGADQAGATRSKEEAKAAAEAALKKVKEGGDFAAVAKEVSDCPSKAQGGDLNFFARKGQMVEPFSEATYKLAKVGDVTDLVETPFGFHVIKLTEMRSDKDIKQQIRTQLSSEKFNQQMQQIIESGLAKAKFNEKLLPPAPKAPLAPPPGAEAPAPAPKPPEVKEE
jgi:peptidyl-prolyl cis-trans isomerase C